jgi:hypothetical protein
MSSKFNLEELYGIAPGPKDPMKLNYKTIGIYTGLTLVSVIAFALVIKKAMDNNQRMYAAHTKEMNARFIASLERQRKEANDILIQLKMEAFSIDNKIASHDITPKSTTNGKA